MVVRMEIGVNAREIALEGLMAPGERLAMPPFQRSYSWTEREALDLLGDLIEAAETGIAHFIGAIVLIRGAGAGPLEIVDGQQRLTTLTLLIAVLRDLEADPARADALHALIADPPRPNLGEPAGWRLSLNHVDGPFFRENVQARGATLRIETEDFASQSQKRMADNVAKYLEEAGRMDDAERRRLADTIRVGCVMVKVIVSDRDAGYKVFRVLNTRGREPNAHDIIKTELFERASLSIAEADYYSARWSDYESQLGGAAFDDLLRQIRTLFDRSLRGNLISGFHKEVLKAIPPREFLDDYLPRCVEAYREINTGKVKLSDHAQEVSDYINRLRALEHYGWRAPALKFLVERREEGRAAVTFFRLLERLGYLLQLVIHDKGQRAKRYRRVIDAIDQPGGFDDGAAPFAISRDESRKMRERLRGRFGTFGQRRSMALRMNAALEGGRTLPPESDATVEHVLPRNPKPESFWLKVWIDPTKRRELCDTLGNFVLLPHEVNQAADQLDFRDKKKLYFDGAGGSHFALTRDLAGQEAWTPEIVRLRTERLADILADDWELPPVRLR